VQKFIALLPNLFQLILTGTFLLTTRSEVTDSDATNCSQQLYTFLIGAAAIYAAMILTSLFTYCSKRRYDKLILASNAIIIIAAIVFLIISINNMATFEENDDCKMQIPHLHAAAIIIKVLLLTTISITAFLVGCCKTESCFYRLNEDTIPL